MMLALLEIFRKKKRLLVATGIVLLLNVVLLIIIIGYQSPGITREQSKLNELRLRVVAAGQGDVGAVYKQGKTDLETLRSMILNTRQFPMILGDILEVAASSRVVLGNVTYKPQAIPDEKLLAYGITMEVSGRYAAVKSFLSDLEKNRELVLIDSINLANTDPYSESVAMDLHLTVYLRESI